MIGRSRCSRRSVVAMRNQAQIPTRAEVGHCGVLRHLLKSAVIALAAMSAPGCGFNPDADGQSHPASNGNGNHTTADHSVPAPQEVPVTTMPRPHENERPTVSKSTNAKGDRFLIVHADDVGMCKSVNRATIEALERGIVTSASIMVPCPAFEEFAEYAREHPEYDYGIHLTLNAEFKSYRWGPVLPAEEVPSLIDENGYLWEFENQVAANVRTDDVERELTAQIDRALERGIKLSHLDTHMGALFTRRDLVEIYVNLGLKYDLPILFERDDGEPAFAMPPEVRAGIGDIVRTLEEHRLPVLDNLVLRYAPDRVNDNRRFYVNTLRTLPAGVSEIIIHCGYHNRELNNITGSSYMRDVDRQIFTDDATAEEISRLGIRLVNWKQFHEMAPADGKPVDSSQSNSK